LQGFFISAAARAISAALNPLSLVDGQGNSLSNPAVAVSRAKWSSASSGGGTTGVVSSSNKRICLEQHIGGMSELLWSFVEQWRWWSCCVNDDGVQGDLVGLALNLDPLLSLTFYKNFITCARRLIVFAYFLLVDLST